jgi:hypothetical protein
MSRRDGMGDLMLLLPPELVLYITTFLFVQDLRPLHLLSRRWHEFMIENSEFIYRNAAYRHRFIDSPDAAHSDAKVKRARVLNAIAPDWKSYCGSQTILFFVAVPLLPSEKAPQYISWKVAGKHTGPLRHALSPRPYALVLPSSSAFIASRSMRMLTLFL